MNHKNSNEEVKRYEEEFSDFLIEKINHAGGSLQFQHLSGILQQLRFEVRDAVASSKPQLMRFLRTHSKVFTIDSKGVVSLADSILHEGGDDNDVTEQDNLVPANKNIRVKIDNGEGKVIKVNPEFAIINSFIPIKTLVYFTPLEYGAGKTGLFGMDIDLKKHTKVCFKAEHGHSDYGIEYRATKVWRKPKSDDDEIPDPQMHQINKNVEDSLNGKGVIRKINPNSGVISVFDRENETVLFYKSSVEDCDTDITNFFKVGDLVEFTAKLANAGSISKWLALKVFKKTKQSYNQPPSNFAENIKNLDTSDSSRKNRIENQPGKLYAYAGGAVIKFGKNQKADGDSSDYYLYGSKVEVSDIIWEFNEGDDVQFDAVKTIKLPGWKAYLVWTGEKPACRNIPKAEDDKDEIPEEQSSSSGNSNSLMRSKTKDIKYFSPENEEKQSRTIHARCNSRKSDKDEYRRENHTKTKTDGRNIPVNVPKFKKANYQSDKRSSYKYTKKNRNVPISGHSNYAVKYDKNLLASKESVSDIHTESSEVSSGEDEFHDAVSSPKKFLIQRKYDDSRSSSEENNYDNESNEARQNLEDKHIPKKASIKKFEDIEGKIIQVLCKAAIIRCPLLQRDVDFVLSAFYVNGESAEERQVIDLKEIIKVGEIVKFNCFEIVDDSGILSQKVTMAWRGPKPEVYEQTPEKFIRENELSVTLCADGDECRPENRNEVDLVELQSSSENSDNTADCDSETESVLNKEDDDEVIKSDGEPEREISENLNDLDHSSDTEGEEESLSSKIVQKLKMNGFFSEDSQVALKIVPEIIDLVLKKYRIVNSGSHAINQDRSSPEVLCRTCLTKNVSFSSKDTATKHAAVQTIVTGEIVVTSDFCAMKRKGAK